MPDDDAPALDTRPLHETADTVLVTLAAAHTWMEAVGSEGAAEAQREATEYLLDARQTHPAVDGYPERWRRRTRSSGLDVTAHVSREGRLAVVVGMRVRAGRQSRRRGKRSEARKGR